MTTDIIRQSVLERCKVRVRSDPDDAVLYVDGIQQPGNTAVTVWPKAGKREFRAVKGTKSASETRVLQAQMGYNLELTLTDD